jgi:hypothetical protein
MLVDSDDRLGAIEKYLDGANLINYTTTTT